MKVLFCRNTHDKDGNLHWWLRGKEYLDKDIYGLGVHALEKEGTTFSQYVENHLNYKKSFPDYEIPTYMQLLSDLMYLIQEGVCIVKEQ